MKRKTKLILNSPYIVWSNFRSKMIARKYLKVEGAERYPAQWRNDYALKKAKRFLKIFNIKLEVIGYENISKAPTILTPNHTSSLDPFIILAALGKKENDHEKTNHMPIFLAKTELIKNRRLKGWAKILDTQFIDRKNPRAALNAFEELNNISKKDKKHQIIFPEGTRSIDGKINEFKSGAFRNAKKHFLPIIPVTINNALSATNMSQNKKQVIQVIFHKPIKPISLISQDNKNIAKNVQKIVESKWTKPEGIRPKKEDKI